MKSRLAAVLATVVIVVIGSLATAITVFSFVVSADQDNAIGLIYPVQNVKGSAFLREEGIGRAEWGDVAHRGFSSARLSIPANSQNVDAGRVEIFVREKFNNLNTLAYFGLAPRPTTLSAVGNLKAYFGLRLSNGANLIETEGLGEFPEPQDFDSNTSGFWVNVLATDRFRDVTTVGVGAGAPSNTAAAPGVETSTTGCFGSVLGQSAHCSLAAWKTIFNDPDLRVERITLFYGFFGGPLGPDVVYVDDVQVNGVVRFDIERNLHHRSGDD